MKYRTIITTTIVRISDFNCELNNGHIECFQEGFLTTDELETMTGNAKVVSHIIDTCIIDENNSLVAHVKQSDYNPF